MVPAPALSGATRYVAWGAAQLFFVIGVAIAVLFAILSASISSELHLTQSQLGTLSGVFFVSYSLGQLVLGSIMGRSSPRLILAATALLSAGGCLLFAMSNSMAMAVVARILLGAGISSTFVGVIHMIGRDFPDRFSFMAAVSQSLSNLTAAVIALVASATTWFAMFRGPFEVAGVLLLVTTLLLILLAGKTTSTTTDAERPEPPSSLRTSLGQCTSSFQFWMALIYYACLFGTLLAYSDLWNIQFQLSFFGHSGREGALLNAMIPLGVTFGSLLAGAWAQRAGYVLPARMFGLFTLAAFGVMLSTALPNEGALALNVAIGIGVSGSVLGLTALKEHLPKSAHAPATALVVTAAFIMGGVIQPLIGLAVEAPVQGALLGLALTDSPNFGAYQRGILWLIGCVALACIASMFFRAPSSSAPRLANPSPR